jgi:N-methylhydantoinase A/oxoprolinase/acetone carboxylase beta subunit
VSVLLGVDTGGTYTDAVLIRNDETVIASAKSLTTRHDLAVGVGGAVAEVIARSGIDVADISMASLSTTLATNALVEGQGGRVALIYIGFKERDLATHGLLEALKGDPYLVLGGGHNHAGGQAEQLDETALLTFLEAHKNDVSGRPNSRRVIRRMNCAPPILSIRSQDAPFRPRISCRQS